MPNAVISLLQLTVDADLLVELELPKRQLDDFINEYGPSHRATAAHCRTNSRPNAATGIDCSAGKAAPRATESTAGPTGAHRAASTTTGASRCASTASLHEISYRPRPRPNPRSHAQSHDLDVRIINASTGELLRHLAIERTRDYQPPRRSPADSRTNKSPEPPTRRHQGYSDVLQHHTSAPEGIRTPNLLIRSQMLYPLSYGRLLQLFVADGSAAAEARGFEPPVPFKRDNSLAVSPIRPLWHAS